MEPSDEPGVRAGEPEPTAIPVGMPVDEETWRDLKRRADERDPTDEEPSAGDEDAPASPE